MGMSTRGHIVWNTAAVSETGVDVRQTARFIRWFDHLEDRRARDRILAEAGDFRSATPGTCVLLAKACPNSRSTTVPVTECTSRRGETLVILLAGGDKRTQTRDIRAAIALARTM